MKRDIESIIRQELKPLADLAKILPAAYFVTEKILKDFVTEYESYIECNLSEKYLISVKLSFKHFLKFLSPARTLNTITSKDIEGFLIWIRKKATRGYDVYFRTLKASFSKAVTWGYISDNPFNRVKLPKKQINNPEYLNELEMLQIAEKVENKKIRNAIKFTFYNGLRREEVAQLRWKNVDVVKQKIIIGDDKYTTKSKRQRIIPLHKKAIKVLEEVKPMGEVRDYASSFVFGKTSKQPYTGDAISKEFKKASRACGVDEKIRFHSLRHSYASYLVQQGVSLYIIKDLLGHQSMVTTERYSHLNTEALQQAVAKFN